VTALRLEEVGAQLNQRRGRPGRSVDPPEELLTCGLQRVREAAEMLAAGRGLVGSPCGSRRRPVGAKILGQPDEEGHPVFHPGRLIDPDDLGRCCGSGRLAVA